MCCIASHTVQMEVGMPLIWSMDIDLIEVSDVQADVIYSNVQLNGVVLKAKQDTGAQINVMFMTVFKDIQKIQKLPLYLKSCIKLIGYGNKAIEYLGTTNTMGQKSMLCFTSRMYQIGRLYWVYDCIELGLIV